MQSHYSMGRNIQIKKRISDDYQIRRERNNVAVKKSREKARAKKAEIERKVKEMHEQNKILEKKLSKLENEITMFRNVLRDLDLTNLPEYLQTKFKFKMMNQLKNSECSVEGVACANNAECTLSNN